jgi:hypothetical protein
MTDEQKEAKRAEAVQWIEEASALLDQAHANMRDLGLADWVFSSWLDRLTVRQIIHRVDGMIEPLKAVDLNEEAE